MNNIPEDSVLRRHWEQMQQVQADQGSKGVHEAVGEAVGSASAAVQDTVSSAASGVANSAVNAATNAAKAAAPTKGIIGRFFDSLLGR